MDADFLQLISNLLHLKKVIATLGYTLLVFFGLFLLVFAAEYFTKADKKRYLSRNFLNDVAYGFFYQGNIYNFLIYAPVVALLEPRLAVFKIGVLLHIPAPLGYILYWLISDFLGYWLHRLQHTNRFLWAFHSVHHSQTQMTFITSNRLHLLDQLFANILMFIPLLILGVPTFVWLPFYLCHQFLESVQHAELDWSYGPLYRFLVSPVFHAIHHSTDPAFYNKNYAKILSIWDVVFGTAVHGAKRPQNYGITGLEIPESLVGHFVTPFKHLLSFSRSQSSLLSFHGD